MRAGRCFVANVPCPEIRTEDGRARWFTQATESGVIRPAPQNTITHRRGLDSQCNVTYITYMAKGSSGRIVIEVEPALKHELYVELARRALTLKAWFIGEATRFVETSRQPSLFVTEELNEHGQQVPGDEASSAGEGSK